MTDSEWADLIREAWSQSVAGIIRTAKLLADSKAAIGEGGWTAMVRDRLPFGIRTAQCILRSETAWVAKLDGAPSQWERLAAIDRALREGRPLFRGEGSS